MEDIVLASEGFYTPAANGSNLLSQSRKDRKEFSIYLGDLGVLAGVVFRSFEFRSRGFFSIPIPMPIATPMLR